jgi:hypothetical protein
MSANNKGTSSGFLVLLSFLALPFTLSAQYPVDSNRVTNATIGTGIFNALNGTGACGLLEVSYYPKIKCLIFSPSGGIIVTTCTSYGIYAGIVFPFRIFKGLYINCSFAPTLWCRRDGIDLGYPLEFRTGVEVAWTYNSKIRLGIEFTHLSNAGIALENPGSENLAVFIGIPIKK